MTLPQSTKANRFRFRAWHKYYNKMYALESDSDSSNAIMFIAPNGDGFEGWDAENDDERPIILMQSTGLTDKNGKEIFEGDIVRILYTGWLSQSRNDPRTLDQYIKDISRFGVVVFENAKFSMGFGDYRHSMFEGDHGEKEVIGNVYEHPHLLK